MAANTKVKRRTPPPGVNPEMLYPPDSLMSAAGIGKLLFRRLRCDHGLKGLKYGGKLLFKGRDFAEAWERAAQTESGQP